MSYVLYFQVVEWHAQEEELPSRNMFAVPISAAITKILVVDRQLPVSLSLLPQCVSSLLKPGIKIFWHHLMSSKLYQVRFRRKRNERYIFKKEVFYRADHDA